LKSSVDSALRCDRNTGPVSPSHRLSGALPRRYDGYDFSPLKTTKMKNADVFVFSEKRG
jgi:hypothetical protein